MFCLARDVKDNPSGFYEYIRNKEGRKKNKENIGFLLNGGREKMRK